MIKQINERELALDILLEVTREGRYSHLVLRDVLSKYQYIDKKERAFLTRLTEGTLERMIELDYILNQYSKVRTHKMKPVILNILRSALYQILYMDHVPDQAACNEAVRLAQKRGFYNLKGFVNGVLRTIVREKGELTYPSKADQAKYLSVRYSMPEWIVKLWLSAYPQETVEMMLADFLKEKRIVIRRNTMVMNHDQLAASLVGQHVTVTEHPYLSYAYEISGYDHLGDLQAFREGGFYVQDISSMLVSEIAAPKEGDHVIDVCAAPGGKSLHMAELLHGTGSVEARDLTDYKVGMIQENIDRCGLQNIHAVRWDATALDPQSVEQADIVIADLPCSGLGVLSKKADIKYRLTQDSLCELAALQKQILSCVKAYVKPGGVLIYSTCTIHAGENIDNVHWFLKENPDFRLEPIMQNLCEELRGDIREEGTLQLLPGKHRSDGFFIAKFRRKDRNDSF